MSLPSSCADCDAETRPSLTISVLGTFRLYLSGNELAIAADSKTAHLILCLVLARSHRVSRMQLLERIWPENDSESASQCLNSVVYSLNKLTRSMPNGADAIVYDNGYYKLNCTGHVSIDLDQFQVLSVTGQHLLAHGDVTEGIRYCQQALALYEDDLCGGSEIPLLIERQRLRVIFLSVLLRLAEYFCSTGNLAEALAHLHRLLMHDPYREDAHRLIMHCYVYLNQRAQAIRQYHLCCQVLAQGLGIQPEPETETLYQQIRHNPASLISKPGVNLRELGTSHPCLIPVSAKDQSPLSQAWDNLDVSCCAGSVECAR